MALFSLHCSIISRGKGGSIIGTGAYNNRLRLKEAGTGKTYNYSAREDVLAKGILLPENAPQRLYDFQIFFEELDAAEKRKDAQLARDIIIALPIELSLEDQIDLVEELCRDIFVSEGYAVNYAIHSGSLEKERSPKDIVPVQERKDNPHAHLIIPFRKVGEHGFSRTKLDSRTKEPKQQLVSLRKSWADIQNRAFEQLGLLVRVSHQSLKEQGIDRQPALHMGAVAMAQERKGRPTERGNRYLSRLEGNDGPNQAKIREAKKRRWEKPLLREERSQPEMPDLNRESKHPQRKKVKSHERGRGR